jgi:ribosomal protein S21
MIINVEIVPRDGEYIDKVLKRFTKRVKKDNVLGEIYQRTYFKSKTEKRREKQVKNRFLREKKNKS